MKKIFCLVLLFLSACSKPQAPQQISDENKSALPAKTVENLPSAQAPSVSTPPQAADSNSFTPPQVKKKQARYFPEGTPSRAIQDLDDMLDSYITDPKTPADEQYNVNLKKSILHGTFDIRELSRLALDKHWAGLKPEEQDHFVNIMTRLLEKKAIFSKEQGQKKKKTKAVYQVTYAGDKYLNPEKSNALATSKVNIPSESLNVELGYKLKREGDAWKIYDIIVDNASLLDNYRYQFGKIIDKDGFAGLIQRMESKLQDLEKKAGNSPDAGSLSQ